MAEESVELKPSEFYVGVIDLFAIFLPGAVITYLVSFAVDLAPPGSALAPLQHLEGPRAWIAFLLSAYLLGHLAFSASTRLDELYDSLRGAGTGDPLYALVSRARARYLTQIDARLRGVEPEAGTPSHALHGWPRVVGWLTAGSRAPAVVRGGSGPGGHHAINTFKLAHGVLQLRHPGALVEVRRLEADSKFFRSVVLLLLLGVVALPLRSLWLVAHGHRDHLPIDVACWLLAIGLLRLSFVRYCEQRRKAVELAYQLLLLSLVDGDAPDGEEREATESE